jgi:transposase
MFIPTRLRPGRLSSWRGAAGVFGSELPSAAPAVDVKTLHAKIGELTLTNDFLSGALSKAGLLSAKR